MTGSYSQSLVAISLLVAMLASYTALDMAGRLATAQGRVARWWLAGGAAAMGLGIWSMHFIAMLAFKLPIPVGYDLAITLYSLAVSIGASAYALWLVSRPSLPVQRLAAGAVLMGLGIAAMHYLGMAAMRMQPGIDYHPGWFAASIAVAIGAAGAALWIAFRLRVEQRNTVRLRVLASLVMITTFNLPVREMVSTNSPALHYLTLDFVACLKLLAPLFIFCFVLAAGLRYKANLMVTGFLVFGKVMDAFIKIILALAIVEHFTGFFMKNFGVWGFDPMFADQKELFRAIEIAGYIGIMLAGTFPICYLFNKYCRRPTEVIGKQFGLSGPGAAAFVMVFANIIAVYHMFKNLNARDKVLCVALGVCAQATIGDHLAFTANFQPTLIMPVLLAKLFGGLLAVAIAIKISVPAAQRYEEAERAQKDELNCPDMALRSA